MFLSLIQKLIEKHWAASLLGVTMAVLVGTIMFQKKFYGSQVEIAKDMQKETTMALEGCAMRFAELKQAVERCTAGVDVLVAKGDALGDRIDDAVKAASVRRVEYVDRVKEIHTEVIPDECAAAVAWASGAVADLQLEWVRDDEVDLDDGSDRDPGPGPDPLPDTP